MYQAITKTGCHVTVSGDTVKKKGHIWNEIEEYSPQFYQDLFSPNLGMSARHFRMKLGRELKYIYSINEEQFLHIDTM
jgi:hypothetical protein